MAGSSAGTVAPRHKYLIPLTVFGGSLLFWLSYKVFWTRPAKNRKLMRNGAIAEELWQLTHTQDDSHTAESRFSIKK